ncbi:uncharacterized protein LOC143363902 [Halictus rubicundus]|uniref:uncharacterized protein LOC143363902 n=1 Tax=Halictus rubicundus TaxID=77578 RepID=UPI004035C3B3
MVIEERVESDHLPVVLTMKKGQKEKEREIRKKDKKGAQRVEWGREGKEKFRRLTEEIEVTGEEIGERLGELERKIKSVIEEIRSTEGMKESKRRGWWDKECIERKKELRRALRKWKEGKEEEEGYRRMKNKYKKLCEEKKEQEREKILTEAGKARTEGKVWDFLRKMGGGKGKAQTKEIEMEKWKEYFMGLLGGVENKIEGGGRRKRSEKRYGMEKDGLKSGK